MGKMLMAKCKTLQEENEEIGNQASEGKMHELAMKLALQKARNAELRNQFVGVCKHIEVLTNDVERSNEMATRKLTRDAEIKRLKLELQQKNQVEKVTETTQSVNNELQFTEAEDTEPAD